MSVSVDKTSWNSRQLFASVSIEAPVDSVWACLTDYDGLDTFIPSLVKNECLQRKANGATLLQVGAQEVAMGVKFSASCKLDITEHANGIPPWQCSSETSSSDSSFPMPRSFLPGHPCRDISFASLDGDFQCFKGIWRMQHGYQGPGTTLLCYALYVMPQQWLPVGLIQGRIEREVATNLEAVREYAESLRSRR